MKKVSVLFVAVLVSVSLIASSCDSKRSSNVSLKKSIDSVSYALGLSYGENIRQMLANFPGDEPIDADALIAGLEQAFREDTAGYKLKMSQMQIQQFVNNYAMEAQQRDMDKARGEGEKFLEENKTKAGVITTESGLQYKVVQEGNGPRPTAEDRVKVHYTGSLIDGKVFESTLDNGEPAEFAVGGVIRGWTEGLQLMPVGSKYIFWIPSDMAYGERGASADIKPNSTLKFEIELLEIVD